MIYLLREAAAELGVDLSIEQADALLKLAKIKGWLGQDEDPIWKTLSGLNQVKTDRIKVRLQEMRKAEEAAKASSAAGREKDPAELRRVN